MNPALPTALVNEIREGHAVLVLGSGASMGAKNEEGRDFPTTRQLAKLIAERFLESHREGDDLAWVAELASSATHLYQVQDFVAEQFAKPQLAEHHALLPTFLWRGLATTNYDRLVERSYELATDAVQQLVPFISNNDRIDGKLRSANSVGLLKLHGCVSRTHDEKLPLIFTVDQYVSHRDSRHRLFQQLEEWATENTLIFVGQSLRDPDLRQILLDIIAKVGSHPRFYIVRPGVDQTERDFWGKKNISVVDATYGEFLRRLDVAIPRAIRPLLKRVETDHPIKRHYVVDASISASLRQSLSDECDYVFSGQAVEPGTPKQFYSGFSLGWYPIITELDVPRRMNDVLLADIFLRAEADRPTSAELYVVKAEAGAGKSVLLRRVAWTAATKTERIVLFAKNGKLPDAAVLEELSNATNQRVFLFVDNPASDPVPIAKLLATAKVRRTKLTIVAAERLNEWNTRCEALEEFLTGTHELRSLNENEVGKLVDLLEKHGALGIRLLPMTREQRISEFVQQADRQILVALHVATYGLPFEDILVNEYERILPLEAQRLYLTVCVLNRLKVPVRAGIISRIHGIPFEEFKSRLFAPLEHVVHAFALPWGDIAYRARHSEIAEIVFQRILTDPIERFNEVVRVVRALNPMYSSDATALKSLLRARSVVQLFPSHEDALALYDAAELSLGDEDVFLLQQRANYERIRENGNMRQAVALLSRARELDPRDESVIHTLAEVTRRQSELAGNELDRAILRNEARSLLRGISSSGPSARFASSTRAKLAIDAVLDKISSQTATDRDIDESIREAERVVEDARQRYPGDPHVAGMEADLAKALADDERVFSALSKAHEANPRDPFITSRLASLLVERNATDRALAILSEALKSSRGDKRLNFLYAEVMRQYSHEVRPAELIPYYRRAFTRWDQNYESQFWFARFAWQYGTPADVVEAKEVFRHLRESPIPHPERIKVRDLAQGDGAPLVYLGSIERLEATYCFVGLDGDGEWVFTHRKDVVQSLWDSLAKHTRIGCNIGFTLGGPCAVNMWLEGAVG